MAIQETIEKQIQEALRAKDEVRLRTLRSLFAAMTNESIALYAGQGGSSTLSERVEGTHHRFLGDEEAIAVLRRAAKQRKDSIEQFEKAGRTDLAEGEKDELAIIEAYLPALMEREEIEQIGREKMLALKLSLPADRGTLMGALMRDLKGRADGADVKSVVDSLLA